MIRLTSCCWSGLEGAVEIVVCDGVARATIEVVVSVRIAWAIVVGVCCHAAKAVVVIIDICVTDAVVIVVCDGVALCRRRGRGRSRHDLGLIHIQIECHVGEEAPSAHLGCHGDRLRSNRSFT